MAGALAEAPTGANEEEDDGKLTPDSPRLFEMPADRRRRVEPDPDHVAFSGSVTLDRSQASDAALYNRLKHGKLFDLTCPAW
jgi:hypothetical protein